MQIKKAIKKGFTLVELVVVIAVIAILAATSVGVYFGMLDSANRSADQQAVVQMNKVLQIENILDDVDSILDVHAALEENGLTAENYTALAKDHTFYFDTGYKKILYVNTSTSDYKVEYPTEYEEETYYSRTKLAGAEWFSLNLSIKKTEVSYSGAGTVGEPRIYNVSTGEQLAYVMSQLDKGGVSNTGYVTVNLSGEIDLMGAYICTTETNATIDFVGSQGTVVKNITSNKFATISNQSSDGDNHNYNASGLIAVALQSVSFSNIVFEDIYVDGIESAAGNVAAILGRSNGNAKFTNVTIKNSYVAGNRNVGSFIGISEKKVELDSCTLDNVQVRTNGGRSSLLVGYYPNSLNANAYIAVKDLSVSGSSFKALEGVKVETESSKDASIIVKSSYVNDPNKTYIHNTSYSSSTGMWGYKEGALISYNIENNEKLGYIDNINELPQL